MSNTPTRKAIAAARTPYARAAGGYDDQFETALAEVISLAICECSICPEAKVVALRTGETIAALVGILGAQLALLPDAERAPHRLRRHIETITKALKRHAGTGGTPETRAFRTAFCVATGGRA